MCVWKWPVLRPCYRNQRPTPLTMLQMGQKCSYKMWSNYKNPTVHSGGGVVPSKRSTKPSINRYLEANLSLQRRFPGWMGKNWRRKNATKWLRVKSKIPQETPGNIFSLAHCVLKKPPPACDEQKQSKSIPFFKLVDFEHQICQIFVFKVCNYILNKYMCQFFGV